MRDGRGRPHTSLYIIRYSASARPTSNGKERKKKRKEGDEDGRKGDIVLRPAAAPAAAIIEFTSRPSPGVHVHTHDTIIMREIQAYTKSDNNAFSF